MGDFINDLTGPSHDVWENGGQILDDFGGGSPFEFAEDLFDSVASHDPLTPPLGFGDLEYLDLDHVTDHASVASAMSAVYQHEDSGSAGHLSWPTSINYSTAAAPEPFFSPSRQAVAPSISKAGRSCDSKDLFESFDSRNIDEDISEDVFSSLGISMHDQNSQQQKDYAHDPLDGLDDFRALLEAAENDERFHTSRSVASMKKTPPPAKIKKRSRQSAKIKQSVTERKRSKIKDHKLSRYLDENFAAMNDGMGVVPKYRAKNRLRSIIKRKPGTQDTDLMSSNVEILGGRVDKQTLAWLRENFEEQAGQIMRREFLYERYLEFCQLTGREAMNAACVGKVVRTVFQGLSTRRLGRRGGSKYHYVNLQVVENSPFAAMRQSLGNAQKTGRKTKKQKTSTSWADNIKAQQEDTATAVEEASSSTVNMASARVWVKNQKKLEAVELDFVTSGLSDEERSRRNILQLVTNCLSEIQVNIDQLKIVPMDLANETMWRSHIPIHSVVSEFISLRDVVRFLGFLRIHIAMLGGLMIRLNFHCIPEIITNFWQHQQPSLQVPTDADFLKFRTILENSCIQDFLRRIIYEFMDNLVTFFLPTKYAPIPDHLRAVLRDVAVKFDRWMVIATDGLPEKVREILISSAFAFCRVVEASLDLSSNVESLTLLERQKSTRMAVIAAFENVMLNGCLVTTNTSVVDRAAVVSCLTKLISLPDGRTMADQWDVWLTDFLQQGSSSFSFDGNNSRDLVTAQLQSLDSFILAWSRLMLELEGAVRFPVFAGGGPCYGVIRFLRDSVGFAVDCEKARLRGQTLIALNAEAISESVMILIGNTLIFPCDYTLEHYIQCGIPIPLVNSQSADFFTTIPEVAAILRNPDGVGNGPNMDCCNVTDVSLFAPEEPRHVGAPLVCVESLVSSSLSVNHGLSLQSKIKTKRLPRRTVAPRIKFV